MLRPVYTQVATQFADMHDKTGRMKAKGVIKDSVPWKRSREFFYYATKRRIAQDQIVDKMKAADSSIDTKSALRVLEGLCTADWIDNVAVVDFFENEGGATIAAKIAEIRSSAIQAKIEALQSELAN